MKVAQSLSDLMGILVTVSPGTTSGAYVTYKDFSKSIGLHTTYIAFKRHSWLCIIEFTDEVNSICGYYESLAEKVEQE